MAILAFAEREFARLGMSRLVRVPVNGPGVTPRIYSRQK